VTPALVGCQSWEVQSIKDLKNIAYVPQAHSFSFSYTVRELSIMGRAKYLNIFSTPSKSDYDIVEKVLDEMGILYLKDRKCSELSGGQLQLVFLARALVGEPKILILDEPESHLDFKNQTKILRTIVQLAKKKNITCIFNTHYPEYALRISDKSMLIGKDDYIIGKTSEIINEENLKKYFGINTKIIEIEDEKQKRITENDNGFDKIFTPHQTSATFSTKQNNNTVDKDSDKKSDNPDKHQYDENYNDKVRK